MSSLYRSILNVQGSSFSNTQSLEFDGVDDYVDCGNPASLQITGALTISAWVKMSLSAGTQTPILSKDNISARCFALWASLVGAANPIFIIFNNNTNIRVDATTNIKDNSWHHILVAFNPSTSLSIYVDGVLEGINTTSIPSSIDNDAINFEIGRLTSSYKFNGNIDEVAVWNSDQSSNVSSIYNGGIPTDLSTYSPVSWWRFEGTGTTATDSGSGGNDGTLINGVTRSSDVPTFVFNRKSIELDGIDDYVTMGNVLDQPNDGSGAFSISLWSKTNSVGSNEVLIGKNLGSGTYNGYQILKTNTGKLRFFIGSGLSPTARIIADSSSLIYGADWKHIVVTYDGSQDISGVNMYINGVSETIINTANQTPQNVSNTVDFQIGARDGSNLLFNGLLDEVAYFNTELSASDVSTIYNSGIPNDISSLSPLSWWRCGDGDTAPTLTDNGSGGNDGTMTNFTTFSTDVPT